MKTEPKFFLVICITFLILSVSVCLSVCLYLFCRFVCLIKCINQFDVLLQISLMYYYILKIKFEKVEMEKESWKPLGYKQKCRYLISNFKSNFLFTSKSVLSSRKCKVVFALNSVCVSVSLFLSVSVSVSDSLSFLSPFFLSLCLSVSVSPFCLSFSQSFF